MVGNKGGLAARANYPWILIGLLWLVAFLNAADRNILLAVLPDLKAEFDLTDTQLALLGSVFFWIYAVGAFVAGRIGDSVRRSRLIIFGLVFWSVATGMSSLATGFALLLAMRALVAVGESTYYPTATALIGDWHKPQMRSRALSLHQTAVFAGSGLGAVAAGYIADAFSWHAPFLIFGGIGLIYVGVLWFFLHDAPIVHTAAEEGKPAEPIGIVLRIPAALILCVVFALATGASTGVTFWAPYFVKNLLGLNLAESAWVGSATINIAGFCAVPLGGLLADTLAKKSPIGRFTTLAIGLGLAALLLLPLLGAKTATQIGMVLVATSIAKGIFDGCIYAAMQDVVPPHARATAVGMMTMIGFLGAGITPILVAWIGESFGMGSGIVAMAGLYALAVLILLGTRLQARRGVAANQEVVHVVE
ncbi:MAG: MFS transporter [Sphingopyxis sp.]|uniref:MFS transporter n=1 Tax=Sphingopyxis sp. TaxID=1908224 RepID=UPI001A5BF126|nr:MFS transporter [Sphingopyxis sp.]MBL9070029.1 MFS transporter [Sphingopyxis sp.]